ncbi:dynein axonemal assembly factor 6 isoform X2 [Chrysoperla carnea]|nr:dynein axonemal assembly factor 6 isoform X2 [Chrysoperla carnea]
MKNQESLLEASREVAKYEIVYRQAVGAEDVFLQMGCRTPATASCEDMIMTIHLPGEERTAVDLNVNHTNISLTSPKYKLQMPLPHPIDPQRSSAKWDPDTEKLTLTLRMNREFDFVNF